MPIKWSEVTDDWGTWSRRISDRFPLLDPAAMDRKRHNRAAFEAYLADRHNLSLIEAREEIEDLLYVETLAREVTTGAAGRRMSER